MDRKDNSKIVPFAKELRKNMTKEERHLWYDFLRGYPVKFTRQKVLGKPISEILFLDDNYNADQTAKKAGMKVCGVYDASSEDYIDDIKSIADYYIYDFSELDALQ